jgi:hypothetical protein
MPDGLEYLIGLLPAILLAISLLCGCYPGEEIIVRLAGRHARGRRQRPLTGPPPFRRDDAFGIREALLLLAASRPLRGPPFLSLAQR